MSLKSCCARQENGMRLMKSQDYFSIGIIKSLKEVTSFKSLRVQKKSILSTWDRISADPQHHTITVLEDGSFEERNFSTWSMGLKNLNTKVLTDIPGFIDINDDQFWSNPNNLKPTALELLRKFYDMG